jgi:signal transduction histidine kinase
MKNESIRILVIHSDSKVSENIQKMLQGEGYQVEVCPGTSEGLNRLKKDLFHFILIDAAISEEEQLDLMGFINKFCPETLLIHISWYNVLKSAVEALHAQSTGKGNRAISLQAVKMAVERLSRSIRGRNKEKESQREAMKMAKELQESNQRLMLMDKKKNDCLAIATHELRTPITIVNGYMKLLLSESFGTLNDKQKHLVVESGNNCNRLINIVNSMLERCRMESESVEFDYRYGPYQKSLQKVVDQMRSYTEESGLVLNLELPEGEVLLSYDSNAIEQTLINLIGNAVKFTPAPGKITVRCEERDGGVLTQVIDTGVGVEADEIGMVFDEFNKVGKQHGEKKGAGLGLSICKKIIHAHHGKIWVESQPGKGSCFSFLLPQEETTDAVS